MVLWKLKGQSPEMESFDIELDQNCSVGDLRSRVGSKIGCKPARIKGVLIIRKYIIFNYFVIGFMAIGGRLI